MKWVSKGKRARLFEFEHLDPIVGDALNRCAFDGDLRYRQSVSESVLNLMWRAHEVDGRIAAKNAVKIRAALKQSVNGRAIFEAYAYTQPNVS
jgi:hypothetical protein